MTEVIIISISEGFDKKNNFFEGCFWFRFNNLGLALGMVLKFNTSMAEKLELKVINFWEQNSYICRSYKGKTSRGAFSNITNLICDTLNMLV